VTIRFGDHYRVTGRSMRQVGEEFLLDATVEGPLPILAPLPPPPVTLDYVLGEVGPGSYRATFRMNGRPYASAPFRIPGDGDPIKVDLAVAIGKEVTLTATVDFENPYLMVTDPGTPVISGHTIRIDATAEEVVFIQPPSGDPQTLTYPLGSLAPGLYELTYAINGETEARTVIVVPPACDPLPHVARIEIAQGDISWFSRVFVVLFPGQQVTDWGEVRRDGNEFHVGPTVECVDFLPPVERDPVILAPQDGLPDGLRIDPAGFAWLREVPIRLVSHAYPLGVLEPGEYGFSVHARDTVVARRGFVVPGSAPAVGFTGEPITEPTADHRFSITYHDPDGLDHESIRNAEVAVVGRDGYREIAKLVGYGSTDDVPSTGATASYAVSGPGGDWDRTDNGLYRVWVDPAAVRDLHGTPLRHGWIGHFRCRIIPPLPPGVNVTVAPTSAGSWTATVEIEAGPDGPVVVDSWEPPLQRGRTFIALAKVRAAPTDGPDEPATHTYDLGPLSPGPYLFIFRTNLGHRGVADFIVPGVEGDPVTTWARRVGADPADEDGLLRRYFFALDPDQADTPRVRPEVLKDGNGRNHLGLKLRRLQGAEGVRQIIEASSDLGKWIDVTDHFERIACSDALDGTEEVALRLREALDESDLKFLRVRLERETE
jgi:hypothetical protein